jgi:hypothetical protein
MLNHKIFVLGTSGTGKTSSLRNLDPKKTGLINCDKKAPPLAGWRSNYVRIEKRNSNGDIVTDLEKSNYVEITKPTQILKTLNVWEKREDLECIVIDTITHMITNKYMTDTIGKDFKTYQQLGKETYNIFDKVRDYSKAIVIFGHTDEKYNDLGQKVTLMKSYGNMINGYGTCQFLYHCSDDRGSKRRWPSQICVPNSIQCSDFAKSPAKFIVGKEGAVGALPLYVPNDIKKVIELLDKFELETNQ